MFKSPSLRNRLILGLLLPLILLRFVSGHLHATDLEERVRVLQDSYLDDTLRGLERAVSELPLDQVPTRLSKILLVVQKSHINDMRYVVRSLPSGKVLAGETWDDDHSIETTSNFRDAVIGGKEFRVVSKSLNFAPNLGVEIARESSVATGVLEDSWEYLFLVQTLMILLVVLVVSVVIRKNFEPLNLLVKDVEQRGLKNLRPLRPPMVPAEVAPIIRTINRAFARLQQERDNQQSFLELASHQLKTPVAGMRATVDDLIRQGTLSIDKPETQRMNLSLDRMQSLCEKLMGLLRVTSQQLEEIPKYGESKVDALEGAKSVIETLYPLALKRRVDLGLHSEPEGAKSIEFPCASEAYNELLAILVDNAIRYSPPGGHVEVVVTGAPRPTLSVIDSGPGIPPELREKVFERFFRILGSGEDGSGLGLSIAKEICSRNHLKIFVEDSPTGAGAKFVVISEMLDSVEDGTNSNLDS